MMPIRISTICLAMMLIAGLNCRAEVSDEDSGNLVICILRMRSFPVRGINLQKFDEFKKSTKDKFMKFSADFFICRLLWCRDPEEKVYKPFKGYKACAERVIKEYPEYAGDLRYLWIEANLHDPAYGGAPKDESQWLLKRLAAIDLDNNPASDLYEDASGQALILAIGDILIRTILQGEAGAPENSGKGVAGAFDKALQMIREARENSKADFILEHKDALLARVEQRLKADAFKSTYRLPLDEIEKAAGKTERISADERRQELENVTDSRELDADAKVNYLLWLLKDGMALTDFSNTKPTREDFEEIIFVNFEIALRLRSGNVAGFTRLAEMIAACGEYNRLVWRVEGAGRRVAKEAKEHKQP